MSGLAHRPIDSVSYLSCINMVENAEEEENHVRSWTIGTYNWLQGSPRLIDIDLLCPCCDTRDDPLDVCGEGWKISTKQYWKHNFVKEMYFRFNFNNNEKGVTTLFKTLYNLL